MTDIAPAPAISALRAPVSVPVLVLTIAALAAFGALVWHAAHPVLPDVGWFAVLAGKLLDGAVPFVDTVEVNTPISTWIYVPVVALARAAGLALSASLALGMGVFAALTILCVLPLARPFDLDKRLLAAILLLVLVVAPVAIFGQREHVALCLLLPFLIAAARRADGLPVAPLAALAIGLAAGCAVAIKPYFAIVVALPVLFAAWRRRSWRALFTPEAIAAAVGSTTLVLAFLILHPPYWRDWLPLFDEVYRSIRRPISARLLDLASLSFAGLILGTLLLRPGRLSTLVIVLLTGATAFWLTAFAQGKLWNNHFYPALALAGVAAMVVLAERQTAPCRPGALAAVLIALLGAVLVVAPRLPDSSPLAALIRERAPARPAILQIGGAVAAGHPLTSLVDGRWNNRSVGQWIWQFADHRLRSEQLDEATRARLEAYASADRARLRADILKGAPDVVIVEPDFLPMALEDPVVAENLARYEKAGAFGGVEIWLPRLVGQALDRGLDRAR